MTWKKCFTDHFKGNGYIVTKTKTLKESVQIVMEKNISIQINFFHNGKTTIATEDTKSIIEETLPLIENELGISFENICKRRSTSLQDVTLSQNLPPIQNHTLSHSTPLKNKNISSSIPRLTSSTEKTSSLTMQEQNIYNRHLQEEIIEIKDMFSNTINEVNNLKKEILLLKEENTNMKDVIDGTQKRNNETLQTNIRNDLDDHVRKIRDTRNEGRQKMCRLEDEIKKVDKMIMELIRDNLTQPNTNLLTKENNNTRVSNIGDKSLGVDEEKKKTEKNIINSKRDRLKLLIVGDSIVRFIDAKKITNHRNSETISKIYQNELTN